MNANSEKITVWDLPTRLFHWLLVFSVTGLWFTGKESDMDRHLPLAYFTLGLIIFRLIWGVTGSYYSKFRALQLSPSGVLTYIRNRLHSDYPGHNPLGSWSVVAMLASLVVQLLTGLFANDSVFTAGPLARLISGDLSDQLTNLHRQNVDIMLALILLHIGAVLFHMFVLKDNILSAMITGRRSGSMINAHAAQQPLYKAFAMAAVSAALVWLISFAGG